MTFSKIIISSIAILSFFVISGEKNLVFAQFCGTGPTCPTGATCINPASCPGGASNCIVGGAAPYATCGGTNSGTASNNQAAMTATESFLRKPQYGVVHIINNTIGDLPASEGGIDAVASLTNSMYALRPASTGYYIAYLKEKGTVPGIKPAYAQTGFAVQAFTPVLKLWELSRNIALLGFTVIFIAIGFMIMLRTKIDPRTVVTVQQAIPKLVVGIILVLFSYAIIGLIIDVVNVGTRAIATLLQQQGFIAQDGPTPSSGNPSERLSILLNTNIFGLFQQLYNVDNLVIAIGDLSEFNTVAQVLKFDQILTGGGITRTVLWIAMFVAVIRTFFMLLTNYLIITLYVIFSPFQFLMIALPGQGDLAGWVRKILSRVLVFPVAFFMLALGAIFLASPGSIVWYDSSGATFTGVGNVWRVGPQGQVFRNQNADPNYQPYWSPIGLGNWGDAVGPLLTLAIVLTIPRVADMVRETIDPKSRPSAGEGEAGKALQSAASRIPMLGSFTKA